MEISDNVNKSGNRNKPYSLSSKDNTISDDAFATINPELQLMSNNGIDSIDGMHELLNKIEEIKGIDKKNDVRIDDGKPKDNVNNNRLNTEKKLNDKLDDVGDSISNMPNTNIDNTNIKENRINEPVNIKQNKKKVKKKDKFKNNIYSNGQVQKSNKYKIFTWIMLIIILIGIVYFFRYIYNSFINVNKHGGNFQPINAGGGVISESNETITQTMYGGFEKDIESILKEFNI